MAILAGYLGSQRAARRSTASSLRGDDEELQQLSLRPEALKVRFGELHVDTLILRGESGAFIDPDRASELADDSASTRSFQDARGIDPDGLLEIRAPLLLRSRFVVSVPVGPGGERESWESRLDKIALPGGTRRKAKLFRLDEPKNDLLKLLRWPA